MCKRIILFLFSALFIIACSRKFYDNGMGNTMYTDYRGELTVIQFDSLCRADTLPTILSNWGQMNLKEYWTNDYITIYFYRKVLDKKEILYKAEKKKDNKIKLEKRIIE